MDRIDLTSKRIVITGGGGRLGNASIESADHTQCKGALIDVATS